MLYTICEIHRGLNLEGISMMHPLQTLGIRKAAGSVAPLSVVVQLAQEAKAEGHRRYKAGQFASGVKAYLFALVSMFPWVASPLVFDPDTAFQTGIVQM